MSKGAYARITQLSWFEWSIEICDGAIDPIGVAYGGRKHAERKARRALKRHQRREQRQFNPIEIRE